MQAFFVTNPEYFVSVGGKPPLPDEAAELFNDEPPPDMPFDEVFIIGFFSADGHLVAAAQIVRNLLAADVWHIGLFIVASAHHGTGMAALLYSGLKTWMQDQGARWIRLGVVVGNVKAERFWERRGYREVRHREGVQIGDLVQTIRVFVKPVGSAGIEAYLNLVARDRPD